MQIEAVICEAKEIRNNVLKNIELAHHLDKQRDYIPAPKVGTEEI